MLYTEPHSVGNAEALLGFLLLSASTPTDHFHGGDGSSTFPHDLYLFVVLRLWHPEEFILRSSHLVVAGELHVLLKCN